jgi:hypothetical protein
MFDIKIECMRLGERSAAKGAGKAGWRHVNESAVTAANFYVRLDGGPLVKEVGRARALASGRGSVVDHTESGSNHAESQQASV